MLNITPSIWGTSPYILHLYHAFLQGCYVKGPAPMNHPAGMVTVHTPPKNICKISGSPEVEKVHRKLKVSS